MNDMKKTQKKIINQIKFAEFALKRNDEIIRFSETKSVILLSISSVIFGVLINNKNQIRLIMKTSNCLQSVLTTISVLLVIIGVLLTTISSLACIFPRLRVRKRNSFLFFGDIVDMSETDLYKNIINITSKKQLRQTISQVYATAKIAERKYFYLKIVMVGTITLLIGSIYLIISMLFI